MKLSVHILAGNCAHTIERCLDSVRQIADEIIVVIDTRHEHGHLYLNLLDWQEKHSINTLRIHLYDWASNSFADARNFAISKCTGDWVICIDADEELQNFEMPDNKYDYYLSTITKEGTLVKFIRMFKNNIGVFFTGMRHNQYGNVIDKDKLGYNNTVFHGFTITPPEKVIEKTKGLLECHLKQLVTEPENKTVNFNIARCYFGLKQYELCKEYSHLALQDPIETPHRAQVCIYLALSYHYTSRPYAANNWLNFSVSILPDQLWGWCLLYEKFYKEENYLQAQKIKDIILSTTVSYLPTDMTAEQAENLLKQFNLEKHESKTECAVHG